MVRQPIRKTVPAASQRTDPADTLNLEIMTDRISSVSRPANRGNP
jgi:hypothetical protein